MYIIHLRSKVLHYKTERFKLLAMLEWVCATSALSIDFFCERVPSLGAWWSRRVVPCLWRGLGHIFMAATIVKSSTHLRSNNFFSLLRSIEIWSACQTILPVPIGCRRESLCRHSFFSLPSDGFCFVALWLDLRIRTYSFEAIAPEYRIPSIWLTKAFKARSRCWMDGSNNLRSMRPLVSPLPFMSGTGTSVDTFFFSFFSQETF